MDTYKQRLQEKTMYTIKYQNLSGDWFTTNCPDVSSANIIYEWKKTGGVCKYVEMWNDDKLVMFWENK
jgi:hypothetical protein